MYLLYDQRKHIVQTHKEIKVKSNGGPKQTVDEKKTTAPTTTTTTLYIIVIAALIARFAWQMGRRNNRKREQNRAISINVQIIVCHCEPEKKSTHNIISVFVCIVVAMPMTSTI